ncbi:hypothetical protein SAMN02745823_00613 [Sporobacter termitidis DSM 10068]|uniref:Uncharacterized protein n=1 Tax=Sporobacter termitidis DSM 10068 TaxID=1123282 RepID=A0A1M5UPA0_9FIRM|nr:hypothetical protein [Sporobacter termitidis]SHH64791.1 hypothetical protein SAMN02745823_00613 [Sporobacter termitidis DSM 10068]
MTEIAVIDAGCDDIAGKITAGIRRYGGNPGDLLIAQVPSCAALSGSQPDILVLGEDAAPSCGPAERIQCGILLMPGDGDASAFDARCIVTYGMSPKNTITLSSISETSCVLAIQREFLTAGGDMLERQEIKIMGGMRPDCLLTVAGALLILGLKISDTNG